MSTIITNKKTYQKCNLSANIDISQLVGNGQLVLDVVKGLSTQGVRKVKNMTLQINPNYIINSSNDANNIIKEGTQNMEFYVFYSPQPE